MLLIRYRFHNFHISSYSVHHVPLAYSQRLVEACTKNFDAYQIIGYHCIVTCSLSMPRLELSIAKYWFGA